jgi:phosphopentomutase
MTRRGGAGREVFRRVIILVLDGVGVGALPDAERYGDTGCDTLGNLARARGGLHLPVLESLGLGAAADVAGLRPEVACGAFGRMRQVSAGKDSTTGHWELAGVVTAEAFPTFPGGFPDAVVEALAAEAGRGLIGNVPASGTEIIERLGAEHLRTGSLILYTSADSVLQLAAHEDVLSREELYDLCRRTRQVLDGMGLAVLRVIARPFRGEQGRYTREGRRDYSLPPAGETVLERIRSAGLPVHGIGKVGDLFCGRGFDSVRTSSGNREGLELLADAVGGEGTGAVLANLLDFDTLYGHRNDTAGFAASLVETDTFLGSVILPRLGRKDLLIVTADHGCDPTLATTDHTREHVPLLVTSGGGVRKADLGLRESFCDVGATVLEALTGEEWRCGRSFLGEIRCRGEKTGAATRA